jgi:hypothetical protein
MSMLRVIYLIACFSAQSALSKVIEHTNSNMGQLKLDAYKLKHDIILDSCIPGEMAALLNTILDVLASLGEDHRSTDNLCESTISAEFRSASEMFEIEINDALSHAYRVDSCDHKPVMEAYYIVSNLAYHVKPKLCPYFVTRWAIYTLRNKVMCKYTPGESFLFHGYCKLPIKLSLTIQHLSGLRFIRNHHV